MSQTNQTPTIQSLYPDLTPEEQEEAAYRLRRYLAVIRRIYEQPGGFDEMRRSR